MARRKRTANPTPIASIEHADTRINIPTEELREFVAEDEGAPGTMLYPRDPSLDPQLVWKGKDEQDREDLAVPVVPVYIQEKIQLRALIEDLRRNGGKRSQPSSTSSPASTARSTSTRWSTSTTTSRTGRTA